MFRGGQVMENKHMKNKYIYQGWLDTIETAVSLGCTRISNWEKLFKAEEKRKGNCCNILDEIEDIAIDFLMTEKGFEFIEEDGSVLFN
jgi:hypothetical protein